MVLDAQGSHIEYVLREFIFPCSITVMISETFLQRQYIDKLYLFKSTISFCGGLAHLDVMMSYKLMNI